MSTESDPQDWPFRYKIDVFRVIDNKFMQKYVGEGWLSVAFLRALYLMQSCFPRLCGRRGRFPAIVIYKD